MFKLGIESGAVACHFNHNTGYMGKSRQVQLHLHGVQQQNQFSLENI